MKLVFQGFENPILLGLESVTEFAVENKVLFSRVVQALCSEEGQFATEPYQLFEEDNTPVKPKGAFIVVQTPFALPWEDKCLFGAFYDRFATELHDDDHLAMAIGQFALELHKSIARAGFAFSADYAFSSQWDLRKYLKTFGYKIDLDPSASLLDNLIMFLSLAADVHCKKPFAFLNLETFLDEKDLKTFCEQAVFYGATVLLLENKPSEYCFSNLRKQLVDLQFCEW